MLLQMHILVHVYIWVEFAILAPYVEDRGLMIEIEL